MRISEFQWDEGNALHLTLRHGIGPEEAEEVFAIAPVFQRTKRGYYAAFRPSRLGRLMVIVFEKKTRGIVRVITGWDMGAVERRYYLRHTGS